MIWAAAASASLPPTHPAQQMACGLFGEHREGFGPACSRQPDATAQDVGEPQRDEVRGRAESRAPRCQSGLRTTNSRSGNGRWRQGRIIRFSAPCADSSCWDLRPDV